MPTKWWLVLLHVFPSWYQMSLECLFAAPRHGESGRGRGRPPCKTARAKKRPARKRSSNRPGEAHASHSSSTFRKSGKKNLKTWSHEIMNFGFSDWQVNCDVLRLSDGTQKPSRPSAFWPTGRGISILTNQSSSMIDETDMWNVIPIIITNHMESYLSSCCTRFSQTFCVLLLLPIASTEVLLSSPRWRQPSRYQKP